MKIKIMKPQKKNDNLYFRINKDVKEQFRNVVESNGYSISTALNNFVIGEIKKEKTK